MRPWTIKISHYGTQTTSLIKGLHTVIKAWLESSNYDLNKIVNRILLSTKTQIHEIEIDIGLDAQRAPRSITAMEIIPKFVDMSYITEFVSNHALQLIRKQFILAINLQDSGQDILDSIRCSGAFERNYDLPC